MEGQISQQFKKGKKKIILMVKLLNINYYIAVCNAITWGFALTVPDYSTVASEEELQPERHQHLITVIVMPKRKRGFSLSKCNFSPTGLL